MGLIVRNVPVQIFACIYKINTDCRSYVEIIYIYIYIEKLEYKSSRFVHVFKP